MPGRGHLRLGRLALAGGVALLLAGGSPALGSGFRGHFRHHGNVGHRAHVRHYGHLRPRIHYRHHEYHRGKVVWRHHGLGHGGFCSSSGVRSYHGLGDGYRSRSSYYWLRPYYVIVLNEDRGHGGSDDERSAAPRVHEMARAPGREAMEPQAGAPPEQWTTRRERAWALLSRGDARGAIRDFAVLALTSSGDGEPRAGYALAAAVLGRHDTAVWAMRRALSVDAAALDDLEIDEGLVLRIRSLTVAYARKSKLEQNNVDLLFMRGALHYLLHEEDAAHRAVAEAVRAGDADRSTKVLVELLERQGPPAPPGKGTGDEDHEPSVPKPAGAQYARGPTA